MLTLGEIRWNFTCWKILSVLNFLPIDVDVERGYIQMQKSKRRLLTWRILFCSGICHFFYITGRLFQSLVGQEFFDMNHFVVHFLFVLAYGMCYFFAYILFLRFPTECEMVVNDLFKFEDACENKKASKPRSLFSRRMNYSKQELITLTYPFASYACAIFEGIILGMDTNRSQLLYSVLPSSTQNTVSFALLWGVEMLFLNMVIGFACFAHVTQMLFFQKCDLELRLLVADRIPR